ncbi:hypothetical protein GCM10027190_61420 [Spirosoma areae]
MQAITLTIPPTFNVDNAEDFACCAWRTLICILSTLSIVRLLYHCRRQESETNPFAETLSRDRVLIGFTTNVKEVLNF